LADDLNRWLDHKPIRGRRVGTLERAVKLARRRPAATLLIGAVLVILGMAIGIGVWQRQQDEERRKATARRESEAGATIAIALRRADDLGGQERWQEASRVLADASPALADANSPPLEEKLRKAREDFRVADILQQARESYPLTSYNEVDYEQRAKDYQKAFEDVALTIGEDAQAAVDYIQASTVRDQLIAAVEDRAFAAFMLNDDPLVERLLKVARLADTGSPWRDRFRGPGVWKDGSQLQELAVTAFTSDPPPAAHQFALLGLLLRKAGAAGPCSRLLGEACRRQPTNFWVHREMAYALLAEKRYWDSIAYCRAAVTMRPDNADNHEWLGRALFGAGHIEEGLVALRRATELSDRTGLRHYLVSALAESGYWKDAEAECRRFPGNDTSRNDSYFNLAGWHVRHHRLEDAVGLLRRAIENGGDRREAFAVLCPLLMQLGRHQEAISALRKAVELDPWNGVGVRMLALELAVVGRWEEAVKLLQPAVARWPNDFYFPFDLGKFLRSSGKAEEAAKVLQQLAKRVPELQWLWEELADSLLDEGHLIEARRAVESHLALPMHDAQRRAERRRLELCNALLAVEARLPDILAGKERPANVATQRAVGEWCLKHKNLTATAAGFYALALEAQPALADDLEAGNRFDAACAAARAGCGVGADGGKLDEAQRAALRQQALDWLTAEYNAWAARHRRGKPGDRALAASAVRSWLKRDDRVAWGWLMYSERGVHIPMRLSEQLAPVRDEPWLAKLPPDERRAWQALWDKVATLAARDPATLVVQARAHVARAEWQKAARCYAEGMELEPTEDGELWFEYAAAQLLAGDRSGYRGACAHMVAQCQPKGPMRTYLVARACTLAADSTDDPALPLRLATSELWNSQAEFWALTEEGALHFRGGKPREAVAYLERSLVADGRPGRALLNWLWLAVAHQKLGNPGEARRWFEKAANWLDQQDGQMPQDFTAVALHRHNWLEALVLRREVEQLLDAKPE
jgi:tetratricopeptide (TPR) repeat protein